MLDALLTLLAPMGKSDPVPTGKTHQTARPVVVVLVMLFGLALFAGMSALGR